MAYANRRPGQMRFKMFVLGVITLPLASAQSEAFNVEDILSPDLMPGSFLVLESRDGGAVSKSGVRGNNSGQMELRLSNGSYDGALLMMDFHRKKMNEYLCHNFLAEDILAQVTHKQNLEDRLGQAFRQPSHETEQTTNSTLPILQHDIKNRLLEDAGSIGYKDWLMRTATLEDIYRHHAGASPEPSAEPRKSYYDPAVVESPPVTEYEEGDVPGYAYNQQPVPVAPPMVGKYGGVYDYPPPYQHYAAAAPAHEDSRGLGLSDLFEISLTALAFLSFGMFVLQVFICLGMTKQPTVMQMIDATEGDQIRFKRSSAASAAGPLVRRALLAMDAVVHMQRDDGACFKRHICESSAYSRSLSEGRQYWLPVWNFGLSWMSGIWRTGQPVALMSLEMLRSCVLGLGGANCANSYPDCRIDYR